MDTFDEIVSDNDEFGDVNPRETLADVVALLDDVDALVVVAFLVGFAAEVRNDGNGTFAACGEFMNSADANLVLGVSGNPAAIDSACLLTGEMTLPFVFVIGETVLSFR